MRSKMYLVLALCSVMLLVSVGISLVLIGGIDLGGADAQSVSTVDSASMVVESGYNKEENTIDTQAYTSTILEQSADAGDSYVDETLFLGDSNTARMYRMFDYCSYDNAIGSVGMTAKSLATFACVQVSTSSGYITMPQAVAKLQPRRVILTFGTNDLNPGYKAADFVKTTRPASRPSSPPTPAWTSSSTPSRPSGSSTPTRALPRPRWTSTTKRSSKCARRRTGSS